MKNDITDKAKFSVFLAMHSFSAFIRQEKIKWHRKKKRERTDEEEEGDGLFL
jgi:hypothetical protein